MAADVPEAMGLTGAGDRPRVHASNAWNPTGRDLLPVAGSRLYYTHALTLGGDRTQVFLGSQQHLTFVAELEGHVPANEVRDAVLKASHLYPHLLDQGWGARPTSGDGL